MSKFYPKIFSIIYTGSVNYQLPQVIIRNWGLLELTEQINSIFHSLIWPEFAQENNVEWSGQKQEPIGNKRILDLVLQGVDREYLPLAKTGRSSSLVLFLSLILCRMGEGWHCSAQLTFNPSLLSTGDLVVLGQKSSSFPQQCQVCLSMAACLFPSHQT